MISKNVQLSIFEVISEEDARKAIEKLVNLSGLHVSVGILGRSLFAYFDTIVQAQAAALDIECLIYCKTETREGSFNVTSLEINLNNS